MGHYKISLYFLKYKCIHLLIFIIYYYIMKKEGTWYILAIIIILFFIGFSTPYRNSKEDHSILVEGRGEVYAVPDTMTLSLRVEENAPTTAEAQKAEEEKVSKIKEILKKYNISSNDIKTTDVNIYEQFDWRESWRVSLGYVASHNLEVKIKNANTENEGLWSRIISEVSEIWGVLVNNINYDIYDKTEYYSQARKLAMEKAYQKAWELAKLWDVKLGKPISIQEDRSFDSTVYTSMAATKNSFVMEDAIEEEMDSDISLWEMKIILDVSVAYAIK